MREQIINQIETAWAGKTCLCFDKLESTNDYAKELANQGKVHGILIVAEEQTAGRGRRGRSWKSKPGDAVAMSLCLEPGFAPEKSAGLTLTAALAVAEAIGETAGLDAQIKWPNDLVVNGRKVCGILTELYLKPDGYTVVIGIGINVNTTQFPEEIREIAGSLKLETGSEISRAALITSVMKHFEKRYEQFEQTEDLSLLIKAYEQRLVNRDRQVKVLDPNGIYEGIAKGINRFGNLIVICGDGTKKEIDSGEVSVRGLYGYV